MNNATKITQYLIGFVGILMFCGSLMLATAPGTANATAAVAAPMNTGMVNPAAVLDTSRIDDLRTVGTDTTAEDVAAEGTDVLPVSFHAAPADLWNALIEQYPAAYSDDVPGIGTFWIEVGTVVDVPGGLYLATLDGWMGCQDWTTADAECSATGPVLPLDIETVPATVIYGADELAQCSTDAQCAALDADRKLAGLDELDGPAYGTEQDAAQVLNVAYSAPLASAPARFSPKCIKAAQDILTAHRNSTRIEEDLSYRKMTKRAAACNDQLATAFYADRHDFTGKHGKELRTFLRHVVKTGQAPQVQMPGKVRAEDGSWVPADFNARQA
jgi:hypothetical protein